HSVEKPADRRLHHGRARETKPGTPAGVRCGNNRLSRPSAAALLCRVCSGKLNTLKCEEFADSRLVVKTSDRSWGYFCFLSFPGRYLSSMQYPQTPLIHILTSLATGIVLLSTP